MPIALHLRRRDGDSPGRHPQRPEVLWKHTVVFDWRQGDVLLLDNLAVGHGRKPYRGPRKVLAALIDPVSEDVAAPAAALGSR
jgi:hypothetical protein